MKYFPYVLFVSVLAVVADSSPAGRESIRKQKRGDENAARVDGPEQPVIWYPLLIYEHAKGRPYRVRMGLPDGCITVRPSGSLYRLKRFAVFDSEPRPPLNWSEMSVRLCPLCHSPRLKDIGYRGLYYVCLECGHSHRPPSIRRADDLDHTTGDRD